LVGGGHLRVNTTKRDSEATPIGHKENAKLINNMENDPSGYGFGHGEEKSMGQAFKGVNNYQDFMKSVVDKARWKAKVYQMKDKDFSDGDLITMAANGLLRHAGSYKYRFGDLGNQRLPDYLRAVGGVANDEDIQYYIDALKKMQDEGVPVKEIRNRLPESVFNAFAVNGKWWRQEKCVQQVIQTMKAENKNKERGRGSSLGDEDEVEYDPTDKSDEDEKRRGAYEDELVIGANDAEPDMGNVENATKNSPFMRLGNIHYRRTQNPLEGKKYIEEYDRQKGKFQFLEPHILAKSGAAMLASIPSSGTPTAAQVAVVHAMGDVIHNFIHRTYSAGGQRYPRELVQAFLTPGSPTYLGNYANGPFLFNKSLIDEMSHELEQNRQKFGHGETQAASTIDMPSLTFTYDNDFITLYSPEQVKDEYTKAREQDTALAQAIYSAAMRSGNAEFIAAVGGNVNQAKIAVGQTSSPTTQTTVPTSTGLKRPTFTASSVTPVLNKPTFTASSVTPVLNKPTNYPRIGKTPFNPPNQNNECVKDFAKYRLYKTRKTILETRLDHE
jgi:hypothetical protein